VTFFGGGIMMVRFVIILMDPGGGFGDEFWDENDWAGGGLPDGCGRGLGTGEDS
jgi:hypothetical protein